MTGGVAFILDTDKRFERVANPDSIDWYPLSDMPAEHIEQCRALVQEHADRTGSIRAHELLAEWDVAESQFLMVVPKEIAHLLLPKDKPKAKKKVSEKA